MFTDYSVDLNYAPCPHRRIVAAPTGGMHYSGGEVWDDIHDRLLCLDCMEYLTEAEIRARWDGTDVSWPAGLSEEDDDDVPF